MSLIGPVAGLANTLRTPLTFLRSHPTQDVMFRDIAGDNLPRALIVRSKDELVDKGLFELGSAAAFFGGGYGLNKLFNHLLPKLAKSPLLANKQGWLNLARTFGIMGPVATALVALPFLRNYLTTYRTGKTAFKEVIDRQDAKTLKNHQQTAFGLTPPAHTPMQAKMQAESRQRALEKTLSVQWKQFTKTAGMGLAASAALTALSLVFFKANMPFNKLAKGVSKLIGLDNGQFGHLTDLKSFIWWALPTFGGLLAASRDQDEVRETKVHALGFALSFFILPNLMQKWVSRMGALRTLPAETAKNTAYLIKFLTSTVLCAALPSVANIVMTRRHIQNETRHMPVPANTGTPFTRTPETFAGYPPFYRQDA
ncbi:MAG: hypothetical protein KC475_11240 [Cyanobacteria bacterium HKST-UBA03]|nr:hypothetical protein [Cyanobacteria bacterium HKST-UBA03]